MADTTVTNETAATTPTGAELVRIVQGGSSKKTTLAVAGHQFRGARVKMTTDDTTVNATANYTISFDQATLDTDSFWSAGSPTRLTIPAGLGITVVELTGQVFVGNNTASTWFNVFIQHFNSSNVEQRVCGVRGVDCGASHSATVSTGPVPVSDGDYFIMIITEESDNSITVEGDSKTETFLALRVLGMEPV